ncbi:molybdenum cofactor biosynthesis protein MoaE [Neorhodopirellula pilleata]|uniref:Molybdopterin synthase catalytic subunit n=1 Tax=Neorhodopirellula pilleata TaxID=2714738 RepID=A0A5C6ATB8_9BACT|nr:molybdenum cofactor biosynthesis protein MoaE [Neorhodopirellula pilleata]TWU03293.1 Molybdopterin synthase catalytic subunit [Neorhodopirellula pilleata]
MDERPIETLVEVRVTNGPIHSPYPFPPASIDNAGAVIMFRGIVRPNEKSIDVEDLNAAREKPIEGLKYQVYQPMTTRELTRLAAAQAQRHGILAVDVDHSEGFVAAGECSFVLQVAGEHRDEAIRFIDEFIVEMKRQVPIWKVPRWQISRT